MTIRPLVPRVDDDVVFDFLAKLGLEPGDRVKRVTIVPGGIEVVQFQHTGSGASSLTNSFGMGHELKLATVTTEIQVGDRRFVDSRSPAQDLRPPEASRQPQQG